MIVKLVILILSLSLNMNVILSANSVVKQQPTRHAFSYTDKSLDQLLPTPAERAEQLITNITSHFSLLENTEGPISEETIAKLKQTFSESFLDQLLKTTGEKRLTMPAHLLPKLTGETTIETIDGRNFIIQSETDHTAYQITMDFPHYQLLQTTPPVVDLTQAPELLTENIVTLLQNRDYQAFSQYVHPDEGLTVTPYLYVDSEAVTFTKQQVSQWLTDQTTYLFGYNDGRGDPINVTPIAFIERFIETRALTAPDDVLIDAFSTHGNSLNNTTEAFPDLSAVVEYHYDGTEEYVGMDWRSLHFVFKEIDGYTYLRAILSDQWTI